MATGLNELRAALAEAEGFLHASERAVRTHGHQQCSWEFFKADSAAVLQLRALVAEAEQQEATPRVE